jgi:two-component system CheB/CheR fusion protein
LEWQRALHPDDVSRTLEAWKKAVSTGDHYEIEYRFKNSADNQYRWHLGYGLPFKDNGGNVIAWFGTATDIEDQKKALEKKDEFIGVASHELKTPLTSLKGYLQLINAYTKQELPTPVKQYIGKANIAINKLQYLVNDLLDVSKIQAGRLDYSISPINVEDVVNNSVENARHIYPQYKFQVEHNDHFIINGNAERLEQVLMNLLNNAVKYSQINKHIIIKVNKHADCVRVSVTDFGVGLSDEQIQRIFERFYRVEDKKFMTSGLGMGLYISSEIITTHKGKIGVDSKLGKGSTFYFDLPLAEA